MRRNAWTNVQISALMATFLFSDLAGVQCSEIPCPPSPMRPVLSQPYRSRDRFYFRINGEQHATYLLQVSTNLLDWATFFTTTDAHWNPIFVSPATSPSAFVRAVLDDPVYPLFGFAIRSAGPVVPDVGGIMVDSYDSSDPNYSTNGKYDPAKVKDGGDLAVGAGLGGYYDQSLGNSRIMGKFYAVPGVNVNLGPNGIIGSKEWHLAGNTGIEPSWLSNTLRATFMPKPPEAPYASALAPTAGIVNGTAYTYVLGDGDYQLSELNMFSGQAMIVVGNARLLVTNIAVTGTSHILISSNATLQIFCAGEASFVGVGVTNLGTVTSLQYYGLASNWWLRFYLRDLSALIYAPNAHCRMRPDGRGGSQFSGAMVVRELWADQLQVHYDESLKRLCPP